jgi:hypothetical protein
MPQAKSLSLWTNTVQSTRIYFQKLEVLKVLITASIAVSKVEYGFEAFQKLIAM